MNTLEKEAIIKIDTFCNKEKLFLYLGLYAGLRRGESLALTVQDINFETNEISINKTLQYTKNNPIVKNGTKTEAGIRIIPLVEPLRECLKNYCQYYHNDYLFMTKDKKLFTKTAYDNMWRQILKKLSEYLNCDVNITSHYLRYTYATSLYYTGVDVKTSQYLLGHKDVKITLDLYTTLDRDNTIAANKLSEYFGKMLVKC